MKHLLLITILFLAGCANYYEGGEKRYQVTSGFTDAEFLVMQKEVDRLCELVPEHCISITRENHWNKVFVGQVSNTCGDGGGCWAAYSDNSREISIDRRVLDADDLDRVFRHEIGHAAGCYGPNKGNLYEPHKVMSPYTDDIDWTDEDIDCIERGLP